MVSEFAARLAAVKNVEVNPRAGGLPGSKVLQDLVDVHAYWALLACHAGIRDAAAVWASAAHSTNHHYSTNGRRGLLVSAIAALAIGASAAIGIFFTEAGDKFR